MGERKGGLPTYADSPRVTVSSDSILVGGSVHLNAVELLVGDLIDFKRQTSRCFPSVEAGGLLDWEAQVHLASARLNDRLSDRAKVLDRVGGVEAVSGWIASDIILSSCAVYIELAGSVEAVSGWTCRDVILPCCAVSIEFCSRFERLENGCIAESWIETEACIGRFDVIGDAIIVSIGDGRCRAWTGAS